MTPMTNLIALLGAALFCASTAAVAQEPTPPQRRSEPAEAKTEADARSIEQLIEALGAETPSERREAERLLQERGEGAKDALEKAVDDHEDPEVRWRARRVLRALNGNAPRLERAGEGVERTAPRAPRAEGGEPSPARGMEDLERRMEEMREQLETMRLGLPGFEAIPFRGLGTGAWNLGTKVEVSPGRVRVELQEPKEGGGTETKVYEADDLDSFRREHPEIAQRVFGGAAPGLPGSFRWFDSNGRLPLDLPQLRGWRDGQAAPWIVSPQGQDGLEVPSEPPAAGERLGIYVGALDGAVRRFLGIEGDDGILVESIEPDSLAAALGIEPRDVVLAIGESAIRSAADVRAALRGIGKGETVEVTVNRLGKRMTLRAEKSEDAPAPKKLAKRVDRAPDDQPKSGGR
jgi:hypothetical protein